GLAVAAAVAACAGGVKYDHNLLHLQAESLESVAWELALIQNTAGASMHALSIVDTPEEALALKARYEKLPGVSRVAEIASLVPPAQQRKLPLVRAIHARLARLPRRGAPIAQPAKTRDDVELLAATLEALEGALWQHPAGTLAEARRAAGRLRARL